MAKKRKFADDGWALWIDGDDRSTIYLNEWINPKGKNYVDISVRIYGVKDVKTMNLFSPFKLKMEEIEDLAYMINDVTAIRALFNANGVVDSKRNKYTCELRYDNKVTNLIYFSKDCVSLRDVDYGTVITIDFELIKPHITADEAYVIFRIPHKTMDDIFARVIDMGGMFERLKSLILSPIISQKYGYSIRINEARLLPSEINEIEVLHQQRIRKALVSISIPDDFEMNDSTCYRIRRLASELNRNFSPDGYNYSDAITYQWVEERSSNMKAHYNFYFTMEHSKISKFSMLLYVFIVLVISAMGGALYDIIKSLVGML